MNHGKIKASVIFCIGQAPRWGYDSIPKSMVEDLTMQEQFSICKSLDAKDCEPVTAQMTLRCDASSKTCTPNDVPITITPAQWRNYPTCDPRRGSSRNLLDLLH